MFESVILRLTSDAQESEVERAVGPERWEIDRRHATQRVVGDALGRRARDPLGGEKVRGQKAFYPWVVLHNADARHGFSRPVNGDADFLRLLHADQSGSPMGPDNVAPPITPWNVDHQRDMFFKIRSRNAKANPSRSRCYDPEGPLSLETPIAAPFASWQEQKRTELLAGDAFIRK